ncbi:MAG: alpha/beta fold hydrolase [Kaiparowitsia implicata GSE-PSE-MK54-09C]|nr:alpha/beta fold hydrolase [Kaiparowitsia implicata GSE-PSE-MK54-09C]
MRPDAQTFAWSWQNDTYSIAYDVQGSGAPVLLLPAFSTVSSRAEMQGLAERLSSQFQVVTLDWLGFGQSSRPALDYSPALYRQLLQDFVAAVFDQPVAVVAAGHSAGYALQAAQVLQWSSLVLVAPTWRGPLTTMGAPVSIAGGIRQLVRSPLLGQALYALNTTPSFLKWMYGRHVYTDVERLTPDFIHKKHAITQQPGARFASAAFVTGALDPATQRDELLNWAHGISVPLLVIVADQAPPKSKAEMEALANVPGMQVERLPGTLGLHEEYAAEVAAVVGPFLSQMSQ